MKTLVLIIALIPAICNAQSSQKHQPLKTLKVAGKYGYGKNVEKGPIGSATIYAKNDSAILFYLDLNRGAPSYNMGSIWGEVIIKNGKGIFNESIEGEKKDCRFLMEFKTSQLVIRTINEQDGCSFGYGVYADGTFRKISSANPTYFINMEGNKIYFKDLSEQN